METFDALDIDAYGLEGVLYESEAIVSAQNIGGGEAGICGEKEVTLDAGTPNFLTLTSDATDPILNPFTIDYDESLATYLDVMVHIISYTVAFKEYGGDIASHTGTF